MRQRHALYLSETLTLQLQAASDTQRIPKSQVMEAALERYLAPTTKAPQPQNQALNGEASRRSLRRLERDLAIATELLATFVRYFVTITPPLPSIEHAAARALGQQRFQTVIEDVARRLRTDRSLMARVSTMMAEDRLETTADD